MSSLSLSFLVVASIGSHGDGRPLAVPAADVPPAQEPGLAAQFTWADVDVTSLTVGVGGALGTVEAVVTCPVGENGPLPLPLSASTRKW